MPARRGEALTQVAHSLQQLRDLVEDDERRGARERVADVRMRQHVFRPQLPRTCEVAPDEERCGQRQPAAERLADADDVRDVLPGPQLPDAPESRIDRVDDQQRVRLVAACAQPRQPALRRNARTGATLHRLGDHAAGVVGQPARIIPVAAAVHRTRKPRGERCAEALEPGRGEREQPGAVVGAVERDDAGLARREQCGAQCDLHGVLSGDAELRRPRQRLAQLSRHLGIREIAERMRDRSLGDRLHHAWIAVPERGDAEAGGEVEVLPPVRVPDAAAFRTRPEQR